MQVHNLTLGVILLVVVLLLLWKWSKTEKFDSPYYFSDVSMKASDPTQTFYTLRERDVLGMDKQDYYLESQRMRDNSTMDVPEDGQTNFGNYTDYLEMPAEYRPRDSNSRLFLDKKYNKLEWNILEGMSDKMSKAKK